MGVDFEYIRNIVDANTNGNLAMFVGSGISKSSETEFCKTLSWGELIEKIKVEINEPDETDFLKVAQYYYNNLGKETYFTKLEDQFSKDLEPSKLHEFIFKINPHIIITTNWDTLLEQARCKFVQYYDVICTDKELITSTSPNKIIKMHGDFAHHNIVFKEDDYLNYQDRFPLIENYIKSILSTHTVLFLGYSYNDINLKLIIQWLQNNAAERPEMYLVNFSIKSNQISYLDRQGITAITLSDIDNTLSGIGDFDQYSKMTYTFLNKIYTKCDKNVLRRSHDVIEFVLARIEHFTGLNGILLDQIQKALSNCGFEFDNDSLAILDFYHLLLTGDFYSYGYLREVYKKFLDVIGSVCNGEKPDQDLIRIFSILSRAGIKGIYLMPDGIANDKKRYLNFSAFIGDIASMEHPYFNFDFSKQFNTVNIGNYFEMAYNLYNLHKPEDALVLTEEVIQRCFAENNYTQLFIAVFNRNILLRKLQYDPSTKDKYKNVREYDIEQMYNNFTSRIKESLNPIYQFVNFSDVYKYLYTSIDDLNKTRNAKRTVESGGLVYGHGINKFSGNHLNLINFVLSNRILIEDYREFQNINKNYVEIAILRQMQKDSATLTKIEIYSCIRYYDCKELQILFESYYKEDSEKKGKFFLDDSKRSWLIDTVLTNCVRQHIKYDDIFGNFEKYIENTLFLLALTKNADSEITRILSLVNEMVAKKRNTITIFEIANLFLGFQYNLHHIENIDQKVLVNLIDTLINKIISDNLNGYEYSAITQNKISNFFGYVISNKVIYTNEDIIEKMLEKLQGYNVSEQIDIGQCFLLNIFSFSNESIKQKIKKFLLSIDIKSEKEMYKRIQFMLNMIIYDLIPINDTIIDEINIFIKPYVTGDAFHSILYTFDRQIEYLINVKNEIKLKQISTLIKDCIKRYKGFAGKSIF